MNERLVAAVFLVGLAACGTSGPDVSPPWLSSLIEQQLAEPVANPPARIMRQEYATGIFYYLPPRCCDIWSELYDEEGTLICHPDGGITGGGDGQCPDLGALLHEEEVWSDPRA